MSGAQKNYRGFVYTFDGKRWNKGNTALRETKDGKFEPLSDDQYDPLNLFSKEEKAKRTLTQEQILQVANAFSVSYADALADAKAQGYQLPAGGTK